MNIKLEIELQQRLLRDADNIRESCIKNIRALKLKLMEQEGKSCNTKTLTSK